MVNRGNQPVIEVLVEWANTFPKDSTWEKWTDFHHKYPDFDL